MASASDDYDSPWKMAITRYFSEFMAFFFPAAHAAIDWTRAPVFLEQELVQLQRDAAVGRRLADKLVPVVLRDGAEQWVLIHLEVQGRRERHFAERIFTYHYRIYDRHRRPVASLVLLADRHAGWRPASFGYSVLGCALRLDFPVVKLSDFAGRLEQLLLDANPFALVTAAHLLTLASKGQAAARAAHKWRVIRLLMMKKWPRERIIDLIFVIDWLMRLPVELELALTNNIAQLEREDGMPYITSFERVGLRRGLQEGRQEGRHEGRHEGQRVMLRALLTHRFGALPDEADAMINQADSEVLLAWSVAQIDAPTLAAVFAAR